MKRNILHLNFDWKYTPAFDDGMLKSGYDDSGFEAVDIPHANLELPYNYFDEKDYRFVSCYRKSFDLPEKKADGRRVTLYFEGAANYSAVYLNGVFVGEYKGGYTPFWFDITDAVKNKGNILAVKLDSTERKEIPPFGHVVDYLCYGGIYREVRLEITDEICIDDVFVRTRNVLSEKKLMDIDVSFSKRAEGTLKLELLDKDNVIMEKDVDFAAKTLNIKAKVSDIELWDIENPKLYTLRLTYNGDAVETRFGFRECRFTKYGFTLNGKNIKLLGLNRHQSYPYVGNAMPKSAQEDDANLLKYGLGLNFVRTAHYPDSIHFLNRCDEIGLLVFTEMPSWQHIGTGEWREHCVENVKRMVKRDRNHPSVALWGVRVNEGPDCDELYEVTNAAARDLDSTRQTGGVRNIPHSHLLEDVFTYNDFIHSGKAIKLLPAAAVAGTEAPYLVTEHNGHMFPTKSFDPERIRTEHALRHMRVQNAAFGNPRIAGAVGWCMADYNTHKDFGSGDKICYHGVTDMFRNPKTAAAVYKSQQDKEPVLIASSSMDIGEQPGAMPAKQYLFTNCDYVKVYKNGEYKSTAWPDRKSFPNLPHPPICPYDYIGDSLEKTEGMDSVSAGLLKDALTAVQKQGGFIVPPQNYAKLAASYLKSGLKIKDMVDVVTRYYANWGAEQTVYEFEGYKNGECVKKIKISPVESVSLSVNADRDALIENETYDVTRIALKAEDQNGNPLPFANNAIKVKIKGAAKVIGPSKFALIGGARAFWVRTDGKADKVKIIVSGENLGEQTVSLNITKLM
ncbi:MAG: glycoside hydrolase family 2 protein [Oscillospiraceae bacterium]|nr:glycoside hydrolase family 2 protein [Oscillospiraceae bacterium]